MDLGKCLGMMGKVVGESCAAKVGWESEGQSIVNQSFPVLDDLVWV